MLNAIRSSTGRYSTGSTVSFRTPTTRVTLPESPLVRLPSSDSWSTCGSMPRATMHLIRLMRMGLEVLETGELRVHGDDAHQLSAIRDGALSFDELLSMTSDLQQSMQREANVSRLPPEVDYESVDSLLTDVLAIT